MQTTTVATKSCLHCGTEIIAGRADKKFCDDYCRSMHNNKGVAPERVNRKKLLAAAPDLLKALQHIVALKHEPGRSRPYVDEILKTANEAINKAT